MGWEGWGGGGGRFEYHPGDGVRFHFEDTLTVNNQQLKGGMGCGLGRDCLNTSKGKGLDFTVNGTPQLDVGGGLGGWGGFLNTE